MIVNSLMPFVKNKTEVGVSVMCKILYKLKT